MTTVWYGDLVAQAVHAQAVADEKKKTSYRLFVIIKNG